MQINSAVMKAGEAGIFTNALLSLFVKILLSISLPSKLKSQFYSHSQGYKTLLVVGVGASLHHGAVYLSTQKKANFIPISVGKRAHASLCYVAK